MIRRLHLAVGLAGVIIFLATGAYIRATYVPITALDDRTRLLLRSRHIYILLASLLNLVLGSYYRPVTRAWPRRAQRLGSFLILLSPWLLVAAFFVQATASQMEGRLVPLAIVAALAGSVLQWVGARTER